MVTWDDPFQVELRDLDIAHEYAAFVRLMDTFVFFALLLLQLLQQRWVESHQLQEQAFAFLQLF